MTAKDFRRIALSFEGAEEGPHADTVAFRVGGRIFATLASAKQGFGNLRLTLEQQAAFVDDPKDCVQKADVLVSDLVDQLTTGFAGARSRLEEHWARGEQASTEDLRMALVHYREFFERLLAV